MHYSVLLNESIDLLNIKPDGCYIDGTFGRGGHSRAILNLLGANGRLIAFDKDPEAVNYAKDIITDERFTIVHNSFASAEQYLISNAIQTVDGVLLDLGVSSPQFDTPERGFSFRFDAALDMRMNNSAGAGMTAADWVNTADEFDLADVFWRYGEEKFSRRIARAIVSRRANQPLKTTTELANLVAGQISYKEKGQHPATRVFQAIRIYINNELGDLESILTTMPNKLALNGRMVIISFHSLEDRIVKNKFNQLAAGEKLPRWVMANEKPSEYKVIAKKIKAGLNEVQENSRSRSAVMRCLERVDVTSL